MALPLATYGRYFIRSIWETQATTLNLTSRSAPFTPLSGQASLFRKSSVSSVRNVPDTSSCFHSQRFSLHTLISLQTTLSCSPTACHPLNFTGDVDRFLRVCPIDSSSTLQRRFKGKDKGGKSGKSGKGGKGSRIRFDDSFSEIIDCRYFQSEIEEAFNNLSQDLSTQCTVHSPTSVFDRLEVNTADGVFSLNELGTISQKSSTLVVVNMSSLPNYIPDVVTAVQNANLNVNPQQDGAKIVLPLPKVTKEHRTRLAAEAKKRLETMKVECRQIYGKHATQAKAKRNVGFSEDTIFHVEKWLKQEMDDAISKAEAVVKEKQEEVLDASRG